jgi:hypothetical protein
VTVSWVVRPGVNTRAPTMVKPCGAGVGPVGGEQAALVAQTTIALAALVTRRCTSSDRAIPKAEVSGHGRTATFTACDCGAAESGPGRSTILA